MIHYIIPSTTSPAMKSPCFKVKSVSYEMKINEWVHGYVMCKIGLGFHCFA